MDNNGVKLLLLSVFGDKVSNVWSSCFYTVLGDVEILLNFMNVLWLKLILNIPKSSEQESERNG